MISLIIPSVRRSIQRLISFVVFLSKAEANADGSATAVKKNITVGEEVDYYTEVTGGDLAEGDKLIYDYSGTVTEGQQFTPEQMYSEQDMGTGASTDETSDAEGMSTSVEGNE